MTMLTTFAATAYSCGAYGSSVYNGSNQSQCASGSLVDTGYDVLLPIFLGVSLIGASVILIVKRALRRRQVNALAKQ